MSEPGPTLETQQGDERLAELADDYLRRYRAGEGPSIDDYAAKHPDLADRIRDLFPAMMAMEGPAGATLDFAPSTERVGAIIGRYKLLERIGEGGFGVVYMAEQQHPVRRKVALKVIKPGIDTRQVIARFEAERQALALMDHENIAKVLDAGATESGRPYFVMELVHGVPITEFCDKNELPTRERLELFVQVCRAVQHAHTKGIIHRDIKPTNVLVTLHEGVPVPKVIDFGVAKATGQQLTDKTLFTHFAQMVGTPLYMSPEQAEMTGIDVDTRSDVYSLGVLLYELLTGTTPLDKERLKKAAFDEVRRIIREEEPPCPSSRLSTLRGHAGIISARRKSDPKQLGRLMRGELDWIVMKALEKERARRYESAGACAADVQRYLRDEPVEACPPSAWYRFRKFARRQKAMVAAILSVASMLCVATGVLAVSNWWVSEALQQETQANAKLERALDRERETLERERGNAYLKRIALADREWSANNLSGMQSLLDECPEDLRGWEWHYLKRLRHSTRLPLRHESPILSLAFSPDGKYLATGTQAGIVRIWELRSGLELQKWPAHRENVSTVEFSPDGRYLATGSWDTAVNIWEVEKILQGELKEPTFRRQHTSRVWGVTFSPNGQRLASAGGLEVDENGELRIWDMKTGQETLISSRFTSAVRSVQFRPDGRQLATCCGDIVQLWDAQTGQEQLMCRSEGHLQNVAFSKNGRWLAAVGGNIGVHPDATVKVWNAQTGKEVLNLHGHVGGLRTVAFSPDSRRLASAGLDQTIKVWDTASGQDMLTLRGHLDNIFCLAFSADGHQLASGSVDNTVRIWDASPPRGEPTPEYLTLREHTGAVTDVAFHPTDESSLASADTDGTVRMWDFKSGKKLGALPGVQSRFWQRVCSTPAGARLAVANARARTPVRIWDLASATETCAFKGQNAPELCLAFSPDGQHVASAGFDFIVRVWNATTGEEIRALKAHKWTVVAVAFSPDGRFLASGGGDSTVRVWDWATGVELPALRPQHTGRVASVAFSRDGKLFASASWDRTIKIWDWATGALLDDLPDPTGAPLCVAFGHDRRLIWGSSDSTVKVWDGPGTRTHVLRGHTSWVQAVACSRDDKWIASASLDGTVKVWRAPPATKAPIVETEFHGK